MGEAATAAVYRFRVSLVVKFLLSMLLGRTRDMAKDVGAAVVAVTPTPRILHADNVPPDGPFVLVANHYERPGLRVLFGGTLISYAVAQRRTRQHSLHWLMTSEWYNYRLGPIPVPVAVLRWLFRRIAQVYGLVIVPRASERVMGRAAAMRTILSVVRGTNGKSGEPIALFPEGVGEGELVEAMPGVGLFLLSLSERGIPLLPAALYEEEGVLTLAFGPPVTLQLPPGVPKDQRDVVARQQVMVAIGRLLPAAMWGYYATAIASAVHRPPQPLELDIRFE